MESLPYRLNSPHVWENEIVVTATKMDDVAMTDEAMEVLRKFVRRLDGAVYEFAEGVAKARLIQRGQPFDSILIETADVLQARDTLTTLLLREVEAGRMPQGVISILQRDRSTSAHAGE